MKQDQHLALHELHGKQQIDLFFQCFFTNARGIKSSHSSVEQIQRSSELFRPCTDDPELPSREMLIPGNSFLSVLDSLA
ncbi:hypothetical protein Y1Q_0000698 [Alligator mississippiensis]|uniref:Uncharacterized protein n=1 Tax=Alligator mississippiensis TaxID=8496 RepID=A0A151MC85_ALLMI|nr:hypothetical protein Y1Q_0000698 [Alligator mississippiensis]